MKVGKRELERIIIKKRTGEFLAEINDNTIESESDVAVELIGKYYFVPTAELLAELMTRDGVALVGDDRTSIMLHIKKFN